MTNNFKKFHLFIYSILTSVSLTIIYVIFSIIWFKEYNFFNYGFLILIVLTTTAVLYTLFSFLINKQRRLDFNKISENLPLETEENIDFETISKKLSNITEIQSKEINFLNLRETYRREFLGNISHELKTPLFSIQGYLLTLIEGGVEDESIRDKYLNRINKSVERLIYLVKDLDMISELENDRIVLNYSTFNIVALTREVIDLLEIKAEKNNIKIKLNYPDNYPLQVHGDIEKIQQVLINLIVNAINYSKKNTKITIDFFITDNRVKINIKDQGIGINQEDLSRIFERFYRVDKSRNRNQGGSGLGLAIVKHILDAHKQKIYVKSKVDKGSSFYFYLKKVD